MAKQKTVEGVSARKPGEKQGEGRLGKVEKQQKKERKVPVGQRQRGIKPGDVDVQTGRTKSRWGRLKKFATRNERADLPTATFEQRMSNIGKAGAFGLGGRAAEGRRPGGIVQVEKMRGQARGPSTPSEPGGGESEAMKRRRARTAADIETIPEKARRKLPAEVGGKFQAGARQGAGKGVEVTRTAKAGEGTLGGFQATGKPAPEPEPKVVTKTVTKTKYRDRPKKETPKKEMSLWEKIKAGASAAATKVGEVASEASKEALREQERARKIQGGEAGTKKQAKDVAKVAEKALVPKFEKPTRVKKKDYKGSPDVPAGQEARSKKARENLMKRRTEQERKARERAEKRR